MENKKEHSMTTSGPIVHFAHANGIPTPSYAPLLQSLKAKQVIGKPMLAHDPKFPPNNQWSNIVDEIIEYIETHANEPVVGIGHSLGSICTFLAAQKRPELFKQVIMLDPPVMYGPVCWLVKLLKSLNKIDYVTPAGKSKYRQSNWSNLTEAIEYFESKSLYNSFHELCFDGYIASALKQNEEGVELEYLVDHEVNLFRYTPDNLGSIQGPSKVPTQIVYGQDSDASFTWILKPFAKRFKTQLMKIKGEHMFPLQEPVETANKINELLLS